MMHKLDLTVSSGETGETFPISFSMGQQQQQFQVVKQKQDFAKLHFTLLQKQPDSSKWSIMPCLPILAGKKMKPKYLALKLQHYLLQLLHEPYLSIIYEQELIQFLLPPSVHTLPLFSMKPRKHGYLLKKVSTGFKSYYTLLVQDAMYMFDKPLHPDTLLCTDKGELKKKYQLHGALITPELSDFEINQMPPWTFKILFPNHNERWYFSSPEETQQEQVHWIDSFKQCASNYSMNEKNNLFYCGWFTKRGAKVKNWKRRFFILEQNKLYYYKHAMKSKPKGIVEMAGSTVRILSDTFAKQQVDKENVIQVETANRTYFFVADQLYDILPLYVQLVRASMIFTGAIHQLSSNQSIAYTIDKAQAGDILELSPGHYIENLVIDKPVLIRAKDKTKPPIIQAKNVASPILKVEAKQLPVFEQVHFHGQITQGNTLSPRYKDASSVYINASGAAFVNCEFSFAQGHAMYARNNASILLFNCHVHHSTKNGIVISPEPAQGKGLGTLLWMDHCTITENTDTGVVIGEGNTYAMVQHCNISQLVTQSNAQCWIKWNTLQQVHVQQWAQDVQVYENSLPKEFDNSPSRALIYNNKFLGQ